MATNTTNYNLKKPAATDNYNVADQNSNMDIIDAALTPTADPAQVPTGSTGKLSQWVSWITNRIKAITGGSNWYDAPATTLQAANTHANSTTAHSATSAATANRIMMRDASGRVKVAAPAVADDVARKDTVDALAGVGNTKTVKQVDDAVGQLAANMENIGDSVIVKSPTPPEGIVEGRLWLDESDNTYQGTIMEDYLAHKADGAKHIQYRASMGSGDIYDITLTDITGVASQIPDGYPISFKANINSSGIGSNYLRINNSSQVRMCKANSVTFAIKAGGIYTVRYNATTGNFILQGDGSEERQGDNVALASSVSGTTLKLRAPAGEYDGVDDNVTITDADFIAGNIKNGVDLFGLVGTSTDKAFASGTISVAGGPNSPRTIISGLGFTPRGFFVAMTDPYYNAHTSCAYCANIHGTNPVMLEDHYDKTVRRVFVDALPTTGQFSFQFYRVAAYNENMNWVAWA